MLNHLIGSVDLAAIERTLQVAIAPAFILGGIMALLSLLNGRLQRLADRYREILDGNQVPLQERRRLVRRARLTYRGITFAIIAACLLCVLVIVSFVEPLVGVTVGQHVALLLVVAMGFLTMALLCFLWEVLLSARSLPLRHEK
ncbi:DUF2721 domain-containing protein [Roseomonas fluvialis]|uniref:DUF2721 domain-containing protein n=1 Tax=Roseomonas fluvialis TaxID=1750527 RepID=A0ABM7Y0I6_9PROT|nr:DUF2721 domain-containing protein [Roseomonas fluvialis]BDG71317.1 hypothetical protein Rmf_12460 [Roseomonas fluvialis]